MIASFKDDEARIIFEGGTSRKLPTNIQSVALRKLMQLNAAATISDMQVPPGNRLEKLKDDRAGQWSIRINDQWRVCFIWDSGQNYPSEVEIVDYH